MKIALLTDGIYPYVMGGMQMHSYNLAKYLAKNKVEVHLFHCVQKGHKIVENIEGFTDNELKFIKQTCLNFPSAGSLPGHYLKESWLYSEMIYNALKPHLGSYDFIYAKGFTAWKLLDEKKKGAQIPPVGVNFHGFEMFQKPASLRSRFEQFLLRGPVKWNCKNADFVFSYGGKITDIIKQKIGISRNKIIEIPSGVQQHWLTEKIKEPAGKIKFVFIGRYERRKGIEEINKVLPRLLKKIDFEFHFVGPIPNSKKVNSKSIFYHGAVNDTGKLKQLISQFDILVCPSHSEGMPNVILEAMASGLAVIATNVGAVCELVDETNGWLISPGNVYELENAINLAVETSISDIISMKKSSLEKVQKGFLWDQIIEKTINAITERLK